MSKSYSSINKFIGMKRLFLVAALAAIATVSFAQIKEPVKWSFSSTKKDASTYEIRMTATIDNGWHIYSQTTPDGGPVPTSIEFVKNPLLTLDGKVKEIGKLEQRHEPLFGVDVKQYSNKVEFVQIVKLKSKAKTVVNGSVEFMTCNDQECLPPGREKFSITLQ
jgi:DsbC/DsbD-like thiol-disulfide interchange protein